jgi:hypothetical protein
LTLLLVRAAAVYALGTFINSCSERTELSENCFKVVVLVFGPRIYCHNFRLVDRSFLVSKEWVVKDKSQVS